MLLHQGLIALLLDPSAWWDLCCFGFSGMTLKWLIHVFTSQHVWFIAASLQVYKLCFPLHISPGTYILLCLLFFPLTPTVKYYLYCMEMKSRQICWFPHTLLWRLQNCKKLTFSDIKSGCWLLRWKMMNQSCCWFRLSQLWSPKSFLFPFGNNSLCSQFFSPGVLLASRKAACF